MACRRIARGRDQRFYINGTALDDPYAVNKLPVPRLRWLGVPRGDLVRRRERYGPYLPAGTTYDGRQPRAIPSKPIRGFLPRKTSRPGAPNLLVLQPNVLGIRRKCRRRCEGRSPCLHFHSNAVDRICTNPMKLLIKLVIRRSSPTPRPHRGRYFTTIEFRDSVREAADFSARNDQERRRRAGDRGALRLRSRPTRHRGAMPRGVRRVLHKNRDLPAFPRLKFALLDSGVREQHPCCLALHTQVTRTPPRCRAARARRSR